MISHHRSHGAKPLSEFQSSVGFQTPLTQHLEFWLGCQDNKRSNIEQLRHQCWCNRFALALLACDWYTHLSHFAHHPIFYLWKSPLIGPGCFVARLLGGLGLNCLALSLGTMPNQPRPNMMALLEDPYILVQGSPAQLWWAEFPKKKQQQYN